MAPASTPLTRKVSSFVVDELLSLVSVTACPDDSHAIELGGGGWLAASTVNDIGTVVLLPAVSVTSASKETAPVAVGFPLNVSPDNDIQEGIVEPDATATLTVSPGTVSALVSIV